MTDDDEFHQRIARTLDRSVDQLDQSSLLQLQAARRQVLQPAPRQWRPAIAIAAMLLMMSGFSWFALKPGAQTVPDPLFVESYLSVEPELMVDWEMLDAIGEAPDA